jgi:pyridoxamine 5'-phosphate oxidase
MKELEPLKKLYSDAGISKQSVRENPIDQFSIWYEQAVDSGIAEPNGFVLSTVSVDARPSQRTVLMKSYDNEGFIFYTNHFSRKGKQIAANNTVSMLFPWYELHRQIIIEGSVTRVDEKYAREYFASRPRGSQVGAWASRQSEVIDSRSALEAQQDEIEQRFKEKALPLPPFWGGYLVSPTRFEFWQGRTHRLHDRIVYTKSGRGWDITRLSP